MNKDKMGIFYISVSGDSFLSDEEIYTLVILILLVINNIIFDKT